MSHDDPGYIAARELDTTLAGLRKSLCECETTIKIAKDIADAKAKKSATAFPWWAAVLLAFAAFWLLSLCSGHR
jgi:hypothetical protein